MCARRAFTLIELLVSMAIIAIIMAILLPSLSAARRSGQLTKCLSNMRQIGAASLMYNTDNDGQFARTMEEVATGFPTTISWWAIENYQGALAPYINMDRGGVDAAGNAGNKRSVWFDPADPDAGEPAMWGSFENNGFVTGVPRKDTRIWSPSTTVYSTLREKSWSQVVGIPVPDPLPWNNRNDPFWTSVYFDICLDPWSPSANSSDPYHWEHGLAAPPASLYPGDPDARGWDIFIDGRNPGLVPNRPRYGNGQPYLFCDAHAEKAPFERTYAGPQRNNMWSIR